MMSSQPARWKENEALLLLLLAALCSQGAPAQVSPCPRVFRYETKRNSAVAGFVTIKPRGIPVKLQVRMFTRAKLDPKHSGDIVLLEDRNALNDRLLSARQERIKYEIRFPLRNTNPVLKDIIVNHKMICKNSAPDELATFETSMVHTFYTGGTPTSSIPETAEDKHINVSHFQCGHPISSVDLNQHGDLTAQGQWPWHAAVYRLKDRNPQYICGGSLVTMKSVITVAHCVFDVRLKVIQPDHLYVSLGKYLLNSWDDRHVQAQAVSDIHVYPKYTRAENLWDLAVLVLASPAEFTQFVRPVCLWGRQDLDLRAVVGKLGYVVGWGLDVNGEYLEELKLIRIPVVSNRECLTSNPDVFTRFTNNQTFCAGFRNGTIPCNGDGGGGMVFPLQQSPNGAVVWHLRGVFSLSVIGTQTLYDKDHYVIFTDLSTYLGWLSQVIQ